MIPDEATAEGIADAIAGYDRALVPADARAFAVTIDRLFAFARVFGLGNPDTRAAVGFYRQALADVPPDLLAEAVRRIVGAWRWGHKLPLPADLRATIADELGRRKVERARLRMAADKLRREEANGLRTRPEQAVGAPKVVAKRIPAEPVQDIEADRRRLLDEMRQAGLL